MSKSMAATPAPANLSKTTKSGPAATPKAATGRPAKPMLHFAAPTGGRSLDHGTRKTMERGYRQNFSDVRIFTDKRAGDLAQGLAANAVTIGKDVYFAPGRYSPTTIEGKRTIAHELAHVAHNRQSHLKRPGVAPENARSETMAERASEQVLNSDAAPTFNIRDWGPTWDAQLTRITRRGTSQHSGQVGASSGVPVGEVDVRTGEDIELSNGTALPNVISIEYNGAISAASKWLQFIYFQIVVTNPSGDTYVSGSLPSTSGSKTLYTGSGTPDWSVDSASTTNPFYEAGFANLRNSSSTTIFDKPGGSSFRPFANREFSRDSTATRVTLTGVFRTFLVQNDYTSYSVSYRASTAYSKSGSTITGGSVGYSVGASGEAAGMPTLFRNVLHTSYPAFTHVT